MQTSDVLSVGFSRASSHEVENGGSPWRGLYLIGGVASLLTVVLGMTEVLLEASSSALAGGPANASEWFALLQTNRLLGLALLEIFEVVLLPLGGLMFLALYGALHRTNESLMAIAITCELISIAIFLSSNVALSMLNLSDQYAFSATEAQRALLLNTGQVLLTAWQGTGHFLTFFLGSLAGLLTSVAMLRSTSFGRFTAGVGIAANLLGLPGPALGFFLWTINGLLVLLWSILTGVQLLQLARSQKVEKR
jgi:hypothetical protein